MHQNEHQNACWNERTDCCFYAIPWTRRTQLLVYTFSSDVSVEIAIAITVALVQFFNGFRNFYYFFMCVVAWYYC